MPLPDTKTACFGISIDALSVEFDGATPVLRDVSLRVEPGQIVALVGASGCGKTTLLRSLAGLVATSGGKVELFSEEGRISSANVASTSELSFVFQQPTLLSWRNVSENVRLPLELSGSLAAKSADDIQQTLEVVGLSSVDASKFPHELSGGMQMRASLARAIVTDPSILLLDEPFAALDDLLRARMNELLLSLHARRQRTIVLVTHNIAEAVFLSDRIAVMGRGTIQSILDNRLAKPREEQQRGSLEFAQVFSEVSSALREAGH